MRFVFLLISLPLFSQSLIQSNINPIYIDNHTVNDIISLDGNKITPYIYQNTPYFSNLNPLEKKKKFIDFILPAILIEKEKIKELNRFLQKEIGTSNNLSSINKEKIDSLYRYCNCDTKQALLLCLAEQPTSIMIAQAAIESGWGTSRFFLEGLNLFGIHTYQKNIGIEAHGSMSSEPIYVRKYDDILASISHYLRILAIGDSYKEFRQYRLEGFVNLELLPYLVKYSERRELYIDDVKEIIEYNNLYIYDSFELNNE